MRKDHCTAVVLAAGQGTRMGSDVPKQYLEINNKPIIYYTLQIFQKSEVIDDIVLVVGQNATAYAQNEIVEKYQFTKVRVVVEGGAKRSDSVWEALQVLSDEVAGNRHFVFIHDGVRMLVDEAILQRAYKAVKEHRACVAAMPVKDTIKISDEEQFVAHTLDRAQLWQIQTPQVFEAPLIKEAYRRLMREPKMSVTDDSAVVESMLGIPVKLVDGTYENIKVTTRDDLYLADIIMNQNNLYNINKKWKYNG